jgi:RNA polymerase-binding protein DksA
VAKKKSASKPSRPVRKSSAASAGSKKKTSVPRRPARPAAPVRVARASAPAPFQSMRIQALTSDEIKLRKTNLSRAELKDYRQHLLDKRRELLGDMTSMSEEALRSDSSNLSHMPLHMADVGSDQFDQELALSLVETDRNMLQEINDALQRIIDGTYGICQATGKPIAKARLQAKPWAKYCIEAEMAMERGQRF